MANAIVHAQPTTLVIHVNKLAPHPFLFITPDSTWHQAWTPNPDETAEAFIQRVMADARFTADPEKVTCSACRANAKRVNPFKLDKGRVTVAQGSFDVAGVKREIDKARKARKASEQTS